MLAYLNCRAAIVASDAADHPLFLRHGLNGFLASNAAEFAESIDQLLADSDLRQRVSAQAYLDYLDKLSIGSVARQLDAILRPLVRN